MTNKMNTLFKNTTPKGRLMASSEYRVAKKLNEIYQIDKKIKRKRTERPRLWMF